MKYFTEIRIKIIKKIIAREFLYALGGILFSIITILLWEFVFKKSDSRSDMPEIIFAVLSISLFPIRYTIYATRWSIRQLIDNKSNNH